MRNNLKTLMFLALLSGALMAFGYLFGGSQGMVAGFAAALMTNFISYWFSDRIVLSMHNAQEVQAGDARGLYEMVERLAHRAHIPTPRVYLIPDHSPNAFATGRNPHHAAIAVTQGLLSVLNYQELEAVLAHELSHVKHRDTLISCIAATMAATVLLFANIARWASIFGGIQRRAENDRGAGALELLVMSIVAPVAAALIQFAVSRAREYEADSRGASLCGNPEWLANALRKIENISAGLPLTSGGPATAHLYIVNPFSSSALLNLFSTHPPIEERIARLLEIRPE
ncbi:MAG: zinc metalloprotease HtpX [Deltaproteobacteria bacterium]|nr:zinc metalloprotease HtpX [Deltaproteobacteria bacterium]